VNLPFATTVAGMKLTPDQVDVQAAGDSGSFDVTFEAGLNLPGLAADGFGLSQPSVTTQTTQQDNPNDLATASVKEPFTIAHAGHATISASLLGEDIDLFVVRDANGDGSFTPTRSWPRRPPPPAASRSPWSARRTATTRSGCTASA
jgi:hypothetical protein